MKSTDPYAELRETMVRGQIAERGVSDAKVLEAMSKVPREEFVSDAWRPDAYDDRPLPIGEGQTISQPYVVASMTEALQLKGGDKVLEIGAGSGYAAAVLGCVAAEVYTIERIPALARRAEATLRRLGYANVHVIEGDGTLGHPAAAPFDAISVTAEAPRLPPALRAQLKPGGRLVMPMGERSDQMLVRLTVQPDGSDRLEKLYPVRFVPLIGAEGWPPENS